MAVHLPPYQVPIAIILIVICLALMAYLFWSLVNGIRAAGWPEVEGVVVKSFVEEERDDGTRHRARITYRYKVGEVEYTGSRIRFGREEVVSRSARKASSFVANYPVGARTLIRYHPHRPSVSVLQTGVSGAIIFGFGAVAVILLNGWNALVGNVVLK